ALRAPGVGDWGTRGLGTTTVLVESPSPQVPKSLLRIHRRSHRQPRPQQMFRVLTGIEHDLDGHALDDLHEVSSRVLWRQQTEARAGGAGDAVDLAIERAAAERVDLDGRALTGAYVLQLRLLEVGGHPHVVQLYECQQRLAGLHDLSGIEALLRD